jgi:hypothetical protein
MFAAAVFALAFKFLADNSKALHLYLRYEVMLTRQYDSSRSPPNPKYQTNPPNQKPAVDSTKKASLIRAVARLSRPPAGPTTNPRSGPRFGCHKGYPIFLLAFPIGLEVNFSKAL